MLRIAFLTAAFVVSTPALAAGSDALSASAPATMAWQVQELAITRRVAPAFPTGTSLADLSDGVACRAAVRIDASGVPMDVAVTGCPEAFAVETRAAVSQWRWQAWESLAERRVTLSVKFRNPVAKAPMSLPEAPAPTALSATHVAGAVPADADATLAANRPSAPVMPVAPAAVAPVAPAPVVASPAFRSVAQPVIPASPYSPEATQAQTLGARSVASGGKERQVVCSGSIVRNRRGVGRKVAVQACPAMYQDAAYEALKEISKADARKVGRDGPRTRVQPVRITFALGEI